MIESSRYYRERQTAIDVAREAGELLARLQRETLNVEFKGCSDLVTDADRASESLIASRLQAAFPDDRFLGEESGYSAGDDQQGRLWVVDPLDGTTNYAHGFPLYAVSMALLVDGEPVVGVVAVPPFNETFAAERGAGSTLNGDTIRPSTTQDLRDALLCSGFPYDRDEREQSFEHWRRFVVEARAVRRIGSAAYDLCCVACGRFDGYWERGPSAWDLAAGSLIVSEAGGAVSSYAMERFNAFDGEVLAATPGIHRQMSEVLLDQA